MSCCNALTDYKSLLYPASSRLQSIPPRFYEVEDQYGNVVLSDIIQRNRARSRARSQYPQTQVSHPFYNDLVEGSTASPGNRFPRSSSEFSRTIISQSRSPSPAPEHINTMNQDFCDEVRERLHHSSYKSRYPETYRGDSSRYNSSLGRYVTNHDSPSYRYYRYSNPPSDISSQQPQSRYRSRLTEVIYPPLSSNFLQTSLRKRQY